MYCIMRIKKCKVTDMRGLQQEACRQLPAGRYNNQVDLNSSIHNITLIKSQDWLDDIRSRIRSAGAKERNNSIVGINGLYTASPQWFQEHSEEEILHFFQSCLKFHEQHYGEVIAAIIHMDEKTPHMHVMSVPITQDGRLSARDIIGNKTKMSNLQTKYYEEVGCKFGLERGEIQLSESRRRHISTQEHRLQQNATFIEQQQETMAEIARGQLAICEDSVHIMQQLQREKSRLKQQQRKNKELRRANEDLQRTIQRNNEKLISIQQQRERALQSKRKSRDRENKANHDAMVAIKRLDELHGLLSAAEERQLKKIQSELINDFEFELDDDDDFER